MLKRLALITLCLFGLNACTTKLAYNFLDVAMDWYVGTYVDLNRDQARYTDRVLDEFHHWHRSTELPKYAAYLGGLAERLQAKPLTGDFIHRETDEVQLFLDASMEQLQPAIAELMASFSDEQAKQLLRRFEKKRARYQKRYVDANPEKVRERRVAELVDTIAPFFGRFSEQQRQWIEAWSRELKPYEALTLKQQEAWAVKVEQALAVRHQRQQLLEKIGEVIVYRSDDWEPELQAVNDYNQTLTYNLIAKLLNSQTAKQQRKMTEKLASYRQDFIELSQG